MIARAERPRSTRQSVLYNEEKVKQGKAIFLDARNYLEEKENLSFKDKLQRLNDLAVLNERSRVKCVHISINFHPGDYLSDKDLCQVARKFMEGIDFAEQPWLLYRHFDAGHPHAHIVSTNIRPDGSRISNDKRSIHHLMQVCSAIETEYLLAKANLQEDHKSRARLAFPQTLTYGKVPTKTGIATVLDFVLEKYTYTTLEHLNAALSLYNVRADRGSVDGAMYANRGLYYRIIDSEGRKLGAPIKASDFDQKPTLDFLEEKFRLNQYREQQNQLKADSHLHISATVGWTLREPPASLGEFKKQLRSDEIALVIPALTERPSRQKQTPINQLPAAHGPLTSPSATDNGHGFFYVEFRNLTVVRDTELGERYTAAAVLERLGLEKTIRSLLATQSLQQPSLADQARLRAGYPDPAETRKALLRLTPQHDSWQSTQEALLEETQHHHHRLRLSM
jgi:hypothetical protein